MGVTAYGMLLARAPQRALVAGAKPDAGAERLPCKAALRDAVSERWLGAISGPLEAVASEDGDSPGLDPRLGEG